MKLFHHTSNAAILTCLALALPRFGHAQETPWSLRAGLATVNFSDSSTNLSVAGNHVPGGDAKFSNNNALAFEIGYALNSDFTVRFAFGIPPTTSLSAAGSLRSMVPPLSGALGKVKYGPAVLTMTYNLGEWHGFRPYVGAGINYTMVLKESDGDIAQLKVKNAWGSVLQAGVDYQLSKQWSLFFDVRKVFVTVKASGNVPALGGPPAEARAKLDPLLMHVGVGYKF